MKTILKFYVVMLKWSFLFAQENISIEYLIGNMVMEEKESVEKEYRKKVIVDFDQSKRKWLFYNTILETHSHPQNRRAHTEEDVAV